MDRSNLPYKRHQRVRALLKEELGKLLIRELDFEKTIVTIVDIVVAKKIDFAQVLVSVLPKEKEGEVIRVLNKGEGKFRHMLQDVIHIKPMPELRFSIDHGLEAASKIEKIFLDENN